MKLHRSCSPFTRFGFVTRATAAALVVAILSAFVAAPALAAKPDGGPTAPYVSACVMEPTTGTVIFSKNEHQPWPTASLAKMMLMLIVAEKLQNGSLKLTDKITTSRKAAQMGGSQVYLKQGETFPLSQMMKAIVVHSANDATVAVAQYVAGSTSTFVTLMNREAKRLGMNDTHYYSVHGLPPDPGQQADVSSAYDEALLARQLVKYPIILTWSAITTAPFRHGTFQLRNTNHLVFTYKGCDGLKTGFYYKAGFNVVATAHRNGMRLIAVVLGSPRKRQNFQTAANMMSLGFLDYQMKQVAKKGAPIKAAVKVSEGVTPEIKPVWADDSSVFVKREGAAKAVSVTYKLPTSIPAPVKAGEKVGMAEVSVDGKPVNAVALLAPAAVARQSFFARLMGHF